MAKTLDIVTDPVPDAVSAGPLPIFEDGFGTRWLAFDQENGDPVELLSFSPRLIEAPGFAEALGERVARLARNRHMSYARVRRIDRPAADSLLLVSDRAVGWRLADVLRTVEREKLVLDVSAVVGLMRQLIPAAALFSRQQRDASNGAIGPDRLILTPNGRLIIADYVLGPAVERLQVSRERLWRDFRIAIPHSASPIKLPPAADVVAMGVVALSLVLGRSLREDEFLVSLGDLLDRAMETSDGTPRPLSPGLRDWLSRALQFDERTGLQSPQDAQVAFEAMLAKERGYVTTPALLESFIERLQEVAGPPPEPERPAPPPAEVQPVSIAVAEPDPAPAPAIATPDAVPAPASAPAATPIPAGAASARPSGTGITPAVATPPAPALDAPPASASSAPAPAAGAALQDALPLPAVSAHRPWMTRALAILAALVAIESGVLTWMLSRTDAAPLTDQGELVIQTRPVAARVTIDGEDRGVTPLNTNLAPGPHILEVRVGRSEPRVIPIQIRAGMQSGIYVELQSVATVGALDVRSDPARARVTVDGQARGTTPLVIRELPPGDHEVVVEAGGRKVTQTVRIEPGVTSQLVVPLAGR